MTSSGKQTCFRKVLTTIGIVAIGFQIITLTTLANYMIIPLGQRAAEDLSSVIIHAALSWHSLPEDQKKNFASTMITRHKLLVTDDRPSLPVSNSWLPYLFFLKNALSHDLGQEITLLQSTDYDEEQWFWVDIPVDSSYVRVGFSRPRIGVNPPIAFFLLLIIGLILTVITAAFLTRRITIPIERLYQAAQNLGRGHWPKPIQEDGPEELSVLTREFNRMSIQVRDLLSNRTTLLAGIAHDLRTPLTQIELALELLPDQGGNPSLMASIREDLGLINRLIGQALTIGLDLDESDIRPLVICRELEAICKAYPKESILIDCEQCKNVSQSLNALALRRIITNLIDNALRYGGGRNTTVRCSSSDKLLQISVLDRGPGIPDSQADAVFRPFYRLDKSRSSDTGGSGLGLAIVKQLADANGWNIKLLERKGGGLEARLTIPC